MCIVNKHQIVFKKFKKHFITDAAMYIVNDSKLTAVIKVSAILNTIRAKLTNNTQYHL